MWHYSDAQRLRQTVQPSSPLGQSVYDLLLGLRGVGVTLLVTAETASALPGFLEVVTPQRLSFTLAAPLPALEHQSPVWVEAMTGPGIIRFQTTLLGVVSGGAAKVDLNLPRQIESVQRRQFSRVQLNVPVVFAPALDSALAEGGYGGHGQSLDLSANGMRLLTQAPLWQEQRLYISFTAPDGTALRGALARVVRSNSDGMRCTAALEFLDLPDPVAEQLVRAILTIRTNGLTKR